MTRTYAVGRFRAEKSKKLTFDGRLEAASWGRFGVETREKHCRESPWLLLPWKDSFIVQGGLKPRSDAFDVPG